MKQFFKEVLEDSNGVITRNSVSRYKGNLSWNQIKSFFTDKTPSVNSIEKTYGVILAIGMYLQSLPGGEDVVITVRLKDHTNKYIMNDTSFRWEMGANIGNSTKLILSGEAGSEIDPHSIGAGIYFAVVEVIPINEISYIRLQIKKDSLIWKSISKEGNHGSKNET